MPLDMDASETTVSPTTEPPPHAPAPEPPPRLTRFQRFRRGPTAAILLTLLALYVSWNVAWLAMVVYGAIRDIPELGAGGGYAALVTRLEAMTASDPVAMGVTMIAMQVSAAVVAWLAAGRAPAERRATLRLTRWRCSEVQLVMIALSTIGLHVFWTYAVDYLGAWGGAEPKMPEQVERGMRALMQAVGSEFYFLFFALAVVPGVCEEFVFRGLLFGRLSRVWSPAASIGVSAFVFSMAHLHPTHVLAVLPVGVWLGYVAWRMDSIVPSIVGHVATLVALQIPPLIFESDDAFWAWLWWGSLSVVGMTTLIVTARGLERRAAALAAVPPHSELTKSPSACGVALARPADVPHSTSTSPSSGDLKTDA